MSFLSDRHYWLLFLLLIGAYIPGLFVPLTADDPSHHANIALRMFLTGDYLTLYDQKGDYLDKPHLLFWVSAFSFQVFGVNAFAYKFPSFLFSILGTYSTYRIGRALYDKETGKLAALILASSFAFILANNDVRMDAMLTANMAFATWHLVEFVHHRKLLSILGAALGLALAFSTKGLIGVLIPIAGIFFYILSRKEWKLFLNGKWVLLVLFFGILITPVLYAYYWQFNLHPERVVRGRDHINGVKFILWDQAFERFEGTSFGKSGGWDHFFFFHTFLWAFLPWCILAYLALFNRLGRLFSRRQEWLTTSLFVVTMAGISFSGFKLPHYLNVLFPAASVMVAVLLLGKKDRTAWVRRVFLIQLTLTVLVLLGIVILNTWAFPVRNPWVIATAILLLTALFYLLNSRLTKWQQLVVMPVAGMAFSFFLLNANFFPQLLKYEAGTELAFRYKDKVDPRSVYLWKGIYVPSWNFYTKSLRQVFDDSLYQPGKKIWLIFDNRESDAIRAAGFELGEQYVVPDFSITKLKLNFVNPATRDQHGKRIVLAEILRRRIPDHQMDK